ncbi:MAG: hypothetical protein ACKOAS_11355 [Verrucomicrobiota bacterium]
MAQKFRPPPEECPVCGADVPRRALACPDCGADYLSGWREDADTSGGLDLPDEDFDYEEFTRREFGGDGVKPESISWKWWVAAVVLILAFLAMLLRGIF